MVQSQGNQAEVQGYAHYVNLSFNRGNFTHKIGLDPAIGPAYHDGWADDYERTLPIGNTKR